MTCQVCNAEIADDRTLCPKCAAGITADLARLPGLAVELEVEVARLSRRGSPVGVVSRGAERPLPINLRASEIRNEVRDTLVAWARPIIEARGDAPQGWPHPGIDALAWRLNRHAWHADPEAGVFADELAFTVDQVRAAVDVRPVELFCGTCCDMRLWARSTACHIACPQCKTLIDVTARRAELLDQARELHAPAGEISRGLAGFGVAITIDRIRTWVARGRLIRRGHDLAGLPIYRVGDCLALATEMRPGLRNGPRTRERSGAPSHGSGELVSECQSA